MQLKLADYGENKEKFKRFFELGKNFLFGGEFIKVFASEAEKQEIDLYNESINSIMLSPYPQHQFFKDEKDPLNRLGGHFSGRTFGKGRFILIKGFQFKEKIIWEDEVLGFYHELIKIKKDFAISNCGHGEQSGMNRAGFYFCNTDTSVKGNIHENPELWEKVK